MCDAHRIKLKQNQLKKKDSVLSFEVLLKVVSGLIFLLFLFILVDLEVAQLIALLGVGHNPQPVPEVVLLQIFLGKILQIPEKNEAQGKTIRDISH